MRRENITLKRKRFNVPKLLVVAAAFLLSFQVSAQLIAWNTAIFNASFGPNNWQPNVTLNSNLTMVAGLSRGASITTTSTAATACWGGSGGWGTTDATSIYFIFKANAGYEASLSSISAALRKSSAGPSPCTVSYSVNGGAYATIATWNGYGNASPGTQFTASLTGFANLQNIPAGTEVRFRWTYASSTGNWYFTTSSSGHSLSIDGTVTPAAAPCTAPSGLTATAASSTSANVSWGAVSGATGYEYAVTTSATAPASGTATTSTTPATVNSLLPGTTYYLHVRTNCGSGNYSGWTTASFTTPPAPCAAPTGLAAGSITNSTAALSWDTQSGVTGYEYAVTTSATAPASGTATTATTYNASSLTAATPYYLHVRANCGSGNFSPWTTISFNTTAVPCTPTSSSSSATACSSYAWHGTTYTNSGAYTWTGVNAGGCDSVVTLNLTINQPTTSGSSATACSSYAWHGTTYTTSGAYTWTGTNAAGCDSVVTLNLTINQPTTATLTHTACSSYTLNGTTYNTSGTYTQMLTNAAGCDSTLTLQLTITQPTTATLAHTACSSYTLNGTTYNTSGTYTQMLTNAAGCDSTLTLQLTITQPTTATLTHTACSSYTLNGTTYNTSGTYTQTLTNAAGCDSTLTLQLTINQPTTATITEETCTSFSYNGTVYTTSGTYTDTLTNGAGCDSIVTLQLTITQPTTSTITEEACTSYTYNGTTYTTSGTYMDTIPNAAGCDSIITLQLTINAPTTSTTTVTECDSYTWNGTTYTVSGTYTWEGENAAGCDSVATLHLTIPVINTTAAFLGGTLAVLPTTGATYQWGMCNGSFTPISGATSMTYLPQANGMYAVIVTTAGCSDTSTCVEVEGLGVEELSTTTISVYPNPATTSATIVTEFQQGTVTLINLKGQALKSIDLGTTTSIDLSDVETGMYFLSYVNGNASALVKLIKQ